MAAPAPATFNSAVVRDKLRVPMQMGLPVPEELQPRFFFDRRPITDGVTDPSGTHLDLHTADPAPTPEEGVLILCAVEQREGESDETVLGTFDADEYILTFLDEEWEDAQDFVRCTMGGRTFDRSKEMYHYGLFDITVYQVRVEARDT